jgi:hypothetical protein
MQNLCGLGIDLCQSSSIVRPLNAAITAHVLERKLAIEHKFNNNWRHSTVNNIVNNNSVTFSFIGARHDRSQSHLQTFNASRKNSACFYKLIISCMLSS